MTTTESLYNMPISPDDHKLGVFVVEVKDSNPNGDPDDNGAPRQRLDGHGFVTPMRIKRMIRSYGRDALDWTLYAEEGVDLSEVQKAMGSDPDKIRSSFTDVRLFGGVLTQVKGPRSRCRGPVQLTQMTSIAPVETQTIGITRVCGKIEKSSDGSEKLRANMGHYSVVPYGIYVGYFFYNPMDGKKVGTTDADLESFFHSFIESWGADRSTQRCGVNLRRLYVLNSPGRRIKVQQQHLVECLEIRYKGEGEIEEATEWDQFDVRFTGTGLPRGVTVHSWEDSQIKEIAAK